jgi:hypothetical protein
MTLYLAYRISFGVPEKDFLYIPGSYADPEAENRFKTPVYLISTIHTNGNPVGHKKVQRFI